MEKELEYLGKAVENLERPYVAIVGGAKVSDKIELLQNFLKIADTVLVGGAMAYTFLKAQGVEIGKSKIEDDKLELAHVAPGRRRSAGRNSCCLWTTLWRISLTPPPRRKRSPTAAIPADRIGLDIGPATRAEYAAEIAKAKTIVWNGPMGVFEMPQFAEGTLAIAKAVAASSAVSIVGGGDSVSAVKKMGVADKISHISTGGGASLEFLSGLTLPGVAALTDK